MSAVLDARQRSRVAKETNGASPDSLTPEMQHRLMVTFLILAFLSSNTQPLEQLEPTLNPKLLRSLKEIDPNFSPQTCLQELSVMGVEAISDLVLAQAWKYFEVTKENASYRSRKEAFEVLHEREKDKVESLCAKLAASKHQVDEYVQMTEALEKDLKTATDAIKQKTFGELSKSRDAEGTKDSESRWKLAAEEWQSRFEEKEVKHREEVASLDQRVVQLLKELGEWERGCRPNRGSHAINEHEVEMARIRKELSGCKEKAATLVEMCTQYKTRIENLLTETTTLRSQLTAVESQQEFSKTYNMSTLLKENANLRSALKTVEQMKMEVENEKVAVQDQLLEYQRRCGVFNKPLPPTTTYWTTSNRTAAGKARAFADGIIRATVAPSPRACPFCELGFEADQFGSGENDFMDHVNSCQGFSLSETF